MSLLLRRLWLVLATLSFTVSASAAPIGFAVEKKRESFISGGRKISVETFAPKAPGRFPAVLVLHSSAGTLFGKGELEEFSEALAKRGMVALMVRYFDRTDTTFANDEKIGKYLHVWESTVIDALNFASAHPRVRRESIGIFGYSLGAFLGVSVASRDARVDAVAELSGGLFDYLGGRLRRVPALLIQHGTADQRVDIRYARGLEREARRHGVRPEMKLYPGEGHVLSKPSRGEAITLAVAFLERQLKSPRAKQN